MRKIVFALIVLALCLGTVLFWRTSIYESTTTTITSEKKQLISELLLRNKLDTSQFIPTDLKIEIKELYKIKNKAYYEITGHYIVNDVITLSEYSLYFDQDKNFLVAVPSIEKISLNTNPTISKEEALKIANNSKYFNLTFGIKKTRLYIGNSVDGGYTLIWEVRLGKRYVHINAHTGKILGGFDGKYCGADCI